MKSTRNTTITFPWQIHAAFTYYYDHQAEFDARSSPEARRGVRAQSLVNDPIRAKLRAMGKIC